MGCKHTSYAVVSATSFRSYPLKNIFYIRPTHLYNFFQDSFIYPQHYTFFDLRPSASFFKKTIQGAICVHQSQLNLHTTPCESSESKIRRQSLYSVRNLGEKGEHKPFENASFESQENQTFQEFFKQYVDKRIVILFNEKGKLDDIIVFLQELDRHNVQPIIIAVLAGGLNAFPKKYNSILTNYPSSLSSCGPTEMGLSPALHVSGFDVLDDQWDFINFLGINVIYNISTRNYTVTQKITLKTFISRSGMLDYPKIIREICHNIENGDKVLIVDDRNGAELSSTCSAMLLIYLGLPSMIAIRHLKQCKPSVDRNYLMNALSFSLKKNSPSPILTSLITSFSNCEFISEDCLYFNEESMR